MTSVIVVDSEFKDCINEYGQTIDSANEKKIFGEELNKFFDEKTNEVQDKEGLKKLIYTSATASVLSKLSDKEFESTFNLLIYILSELEGSLLLLFNEKSTLVESLVQCIPTEEPSLRDRKCIKATTILSVLNTIFNFLPETSKERVFILSTILKVVEQSYTSFELIQNSVGNQLVRWLETAGASVEIIKQLFWRFISLDDQQRRETLDLIKSFTAKYSLTLEELQQLIKFSLLSNTVDISFLVNNNVAKALQSFSNDDYVQLFQKYIKGELATSVPSELKHSQEFIYQKSRIVALAQFFVANEGKGIFKYSDIPSSLVSSSADFELLLINSIKSGVIEGRLNQVEEVFALSRVNRFILAGDDESINKNWASVRQSLTEWKGALENIEEIVNATRENIVNSNSD